MTQELEPARAAVSGAVELEAELRVASQELDEANIVVDSLVAIVDANVKRAESAEAELATLRSDNERLGRERDDARETNRSLNRRLSKYTGDETAFRMRHLVWSTILCKTPLVPAASGKPGHKDFDFQAWQINVDREYANGRAEAAEAERDTLLAQVEALTSALKFYADPANWTNDEQVNRDEIFDTAMSLDEHGSRARAALTKEPS